MKKIYLVFLTVILMAGFTKVQAQALQFSTTSLSLDTNLTNQLEGIETYVQVTNSSGQADTVYWMPVVIQLDSVWQLSFCDPNECYYYTKSISSHATRHFPAAAGSNYQLRFGSSPDCMADTGELQILMWLEHDSAGSATVLTYKAQYTGSCTTGINPVAADNFDNVNLYPNPACNQLTIQFGLTQAAPVTAYVTNIMGQRVADIYRGQLNTGVHTLTTGATNLANGVYFVTLKTGDNAVTQRFVVAR